MLRKLAEDDTLLGCDIFEDEREVDLDCESRLGDTAIGDQSKERRRELLPCALNFYKLHRATEYESFWILQDSAEMLGRKTQSSSAQHHV